MHLEGTLKQKELSSMKKFKTLTSNTGLYEKNEILELVEDNGSIFSWYRNNEGRIICVFSGHLVELKESSSIPKKQPKFTQGDRVRVIGNTTANCKHFVQLGTTGVVDYCKYSEKYHNEMALVSCVDGLQQHIGTQDLELIPKEPPCIPKEQPKFSKGDTVRITKRLHGHAFKIGEIVKVEKVMPLNYLVTNNVSTWCVTEEEIEKVLLDKQGYPLAVGDKVMICTSDVTSMQGKQGHIIAFLDDKVQVKLVSRKQFIMISQELLTLSKNNLPYNVDVTIYSDQPTTFMGMLRDNYEVKNAVQATCSPTDEFSWETGVYGVLIPRLFNCPIRMGV